MAVNLTNADSALKSYYLDAVTEQLNKNTNPFLAQIKHTSDFVYGKDVRCFTTYGINGGIGAGTEDGELPIATGNLYAQMVSTLKNLYGTIEISDKAIRASENNSGAFVSLLNMEMEGLIKSSSFNLGRMLFGDGTGELGAVVGIDGTVITVNNTSAFFEGMVVDIRTSLTKIIFPEAAGRTILAVDRKNKTIKLSGANLSISTIPAKSVITMRGSFGNEITGLGAIFGSGNTLYGLSRETNSWLNPYSKEEVGELSENVIQTAIDEIEANSGSSVNFIVCSWGVRRALAEVLSASRRAVDTMTLEGGFKAITFNGIPVVADRFCPEGTMYLLNTNDFAFHQLCDWQWMEADDGRILKQVPGKPVYTSTLVKYADLLCSRPSGQGVLKGITEA